MLYIWKICGGYRLELEYSTPHKDINYTCDYIYYSKRNAIRKMRTETGTKGIKFKTYDFSTN